MNALQRRTLTGLWLVTLTGGERGVILNGVAVDGCHDASGAARITEMAERLATALGALLQGMTWRKPALMQWEWSDVAEDITRCATKVECVRRRITLMHSHFPAGSAVHFAGHSTLSGSDHNLWFPVPDGADLFAWVETIMTLNHAALNITDMSPRLKLDKCTDYDLRYNAVIPAPTQA